MRTYVHQITVSVVNFKSTQELIKENATEKQKQKLEQFLKGS